MDAQDEQDKGKASLILSILYIHIHVKTVRCESL